MIALSPEKARIFRITHIENVPWILANGLHCRNSPAQHGGYRGIGNPEIIEKRHHRAVPVAPGGTLSDYVPFYLTPHSPMLLNIKTGYGGVTQTPMPEIAILVANLHDLTERGIDFLVTDRHAYLLTAKFVRGLEGLKHVDWSLLQSRDFKRDPNDPGKFERYQAEALIHGELPIAGIRAILCYGPEQERRLQALCAAAGSDTRVLARPECFF